MNNTAKEFTRLKQIIADLRGKNGCPWDRKQTHQSLKPYLIEEAYEVLEAIDERDYKKLAEELGDLLLQIMLHAQLASEKKKFGVAEVIRLISEKMVRRHPHVFASEKRGRARTVEEVWGHWEEIKKEELKAAGKAFRSVLEGVPKTLPALVRADKVQRRAARVGFDWEKVIDPWRKVLEELRELGFLLRQPKRNSKRINEEFGDLLFAMVNVSRKLGIDAEDALKAAVKKFSARFNYIEKEARRQKRALRELGLTEMDRLWAEVKGKARAV